MMSVLELVLAYVAFMVTFLLSYRYFLSREDKR